MKKKHLSNAELLSRLQRIQGFLMTQRENLELCSLALTEIQKDYGLAGGGDNDDKA